MMLIACLLTGCGRDRTAEPQDTIYGLGGEKDMGEGTPGGEQHSGTATQSGSVAQNGAESQAGGQQNDSYQDTHMSLNRSYCLASVTDRYIYGCYVDQNAFVIAFQEKESGRIEQEVCLPVTADQVYVGSLAAGSEGELLVTAHNYDGVQNYCFCIDAQGEVQELEEPALEDMERAKFPGIRGIGTDEEGLIYLWYELSLPMEDIMEEISPQDKDVYKRVDRIYVRDAQMQPLFYLQFDGEKSGSLEGFHSDGKTPFVIVREEEELTVRTIDAQKQELSSEGRQLSGGILPDGMQFLASSEDGFLFNREGELYKYRFAEERCEKLLNLSSYGILSTGLLYLGCNGDTIEILDNYGEDNGSELTILKQGNSEKQLITVGMMLLDRSLEKTIAAFNRYHQDMRVEAVEYYDQEEGFDRGLERLKLDLIQGKGPDVIEVSSLDWEVLAQKGILDDLYEYMDGDKECGRELLMSSVLKVNEKNGKLYSIAPAFTIFSMWGSRQEIGEQTGVSLAQLKQLLKKKEKTLNAIYGFSADEPVLTSLCAYGMDEFVDWENRSCDFTGDYFKELLTFAGEYSGSFQSTLPQGIRDGDILISLGTITSVADYQIQKTLYGGELTFIGYPTVQGSGTAAGFSVGELSINQASSGKEAAWEFVKYNLQNGYDGIGFPVVRSLFEEVMKQAKEAEMVQEPEGTYELPKGTYSDRDTFFQVFGASDSDVQQVRALVESVDHCHRYHTELMNIILEEAEGYFAGQKNLEETVKIIQKRALLYLQESV